MEATGEERRSVRIIGLAEWGGLGITRSETARDT
jgi:hypothetical protein